MKDMRSVRYAIVLSLLTAVGSASAQTADTLDHKLGDVVVTGTRVAADQRHQPYTVSVVGREKLTEQQRLNILPTLCEEVPGLFLTSRGVMGYAVSTNAAGGLSLRGLGSSTGQMLVLIDGHPQYQGIYSHSIADASQTMLADRVEVLRGPASVLYGSNAMGGVINIVTREKRKDGAQTSVNLGAGNYGTVQAEAANQVRSGRYSHTVAANYARTDNHRSNMGFEQYGGYAKFNYDIAEHWNAYADFNLTHFNASNPGPVSRPLYDARQWITRGAATVALENHYGRTSGALSVYTNFGRHKINDGTADPSNPSQRYFRSKDALTGVSLWQSVDLWQGGRVSGGLDYQHIYGRAFYTSIATGEVLDTPNKQSGHSHRNELAVYAQMRQDLASWLTLDAGVRMDHHSITGTEWIPQGGLVVRPIANGALKATVSKGFRNPSMREMYLYPPSNTELAPERLVQYELSWRHSLMDNRLNYAFNLYYIKGDNIIQTQQVDGRPRNVNTGEIENTGAELEATWRVCDRLTLNTNHSVLHMHNHMLASPEYKGYLGATYNGRCWGVTAGVMQVAGLFTDTAAATENFTMLNASVYYKPMSMLKLWLRGENLLAQRYEINAGFPMPRATVMAGVLLNI